MRLEQPDQLNITSETEVLNRLLNFAFRNKFSVALWQLPGESVKNLVISKEIERVQRDKLQVSSGFIFAPFDRNESAILLSADYFFSFKHGSLLPNTNTANNDSFALLDSLSKESKLIVRYVSSNHHHDIKTDSFLTMVREGISEIKKGTFEKIVPSRTRAVDLPDNFDILSAFGRLCDSFPNALVSLVSTPESGTWMGATPEVLVSVDENQIFKTVALAGTQPYHEGINLKNVAWTQKEIEEQALVERYIISCFKKIRLREYEEHGPKTVVAGNLMHLKSDFTVDMKETNFPQLGSIMLQLLHPTSAVCGMPLDAALTFLKENEGYNRGFYSGFLGPVNIHQQINIFVNLRCMQLLEEQAILYAGAGVTEDSIAEKEWEETEMKMNTLMSVLNP